jgi:putative ABC transport system permease protein
MTSWFRRRRRDDDLDDEIRAHLEMAARERMERGETAADAAAGARREFGNVLLVKEVTRGMWSGAGFSATAGDLRIALRTLGRTRAFTAAVVLSVGVGIAATVTISSAIDAVFLRPLPYPHAADLVALRARQAARGETGAVITRESLEAWSAASSLAQIAAWSGSPADVTGPEDLPERVDGALVAPELFPLLGVAPMLGGGFTPEDAVVGAEAVVILSDALWRRRFGGDAAIVGRRVPIDGSPRTVRGVMPPGFSFPEGAVIWRPLVVPPVPPGVLLFDGALARLAPGVTLDQARAEFDARTGTFQGGEGYAGWQFDLVPLREHLVEGLRRPLLLVQVAALLVLLLACANVAALLLARTMARERELATRAALGAGGPRLAMHVLTECLALAILAGFLGVVLAHVGLGLLAFAFPDGVPSYVDLRLQPGAVALAVLLAIGTAALFGLLPAWRVARTRAYTTLFGSGRTTASGGRGWAFPALVVAQVALAVLLLGVAALLARTYQALEESLGFKPEGVLAVTIQLPSRQYPSAARRAAFYTQLEERLRGLPGVVQASASVSAAPLDSGITSGLVRFRLEDAASPTDEQRAAGQFVAPGYFEALGVPLVAGRDFHTEETQGGDAVAIVNETLARRYFPDGDALGRRLLLQSGTRVVRIVGVARDFRHRPPPAEIPASIFIPQTAGLMTQTFVLRTTMTNPAALAPAVRQAVSDLDPALAIARLHGQAALVERTFWRQRLQRNVLGIFALVALGLAVLGTYGVVAFTVAARRSEFGVRLALGAARGRLLLDVVSRAAGLALVGVLLGLAGTFALGRVIAGSLYGVAPADPAALAMAAGTVLTVAVLAALLPGVTAARLDPADILRDA